MGGDQIVASLAGDRVEEELGDEIREAEGELYAELIDEVRPLEGSRELIAELKDRGHAVVLASSAKEDEVDHYLDLLDARDLADDWTTSADVEATKPEPDLVHAALEKAGLEDGVMIGDSTWDIKAAKRAGIETLAVMTGGFSAAELRDAGAVAVYESVVELREALDETDARLAALRRALERGEQEDRRRRVVDRRLRGDVVGPVVLVGDVAVEGAAAGRRA